MGSLAWVIAGPVFAVLIAGCTTIPLTPAQSAGLKEAQRSLTLN